MILIGVVRRTDVIHFLMFGYRPARGSACTGAFWDWTTLALRRSLAKHVTPDMKILDMGTGTVAVLALFCALRLRCASVMAVDYVAQVLESARCNVEKYCPERIEVLRSDLFREVRGRYDLIVFNAPYLDGTRVSAREVLSNEIQKRRFSGGEGGKETIVRFLSGAPGFLCEDGRILLGVNHFHIGQETLVELIEDSGFDLVERVESKCLPGSAYLLGLKDPIGRHEKPGGCDV